MKPEDWYQNKYLFAQQTNNEKYIQIKIYTSKFKREITCYRARQ